MFAFHFCNHFTFHDKKTSFHKRSQSSYNVSSVGKEYSISRFVLDLFQKSVLNFPLILCKKFLSLCRFLGILLIKLGSIEVVLNYPQKGKRALETLILVFISNGQR